MIFKFNHCMPKGWKREALVLLLGRAGLVNGKFLIFTGGIIDPRPKNHDVLQLEFTHVPDSDMMVVVLEPDHPKHRFIWRKYDDYVCFDALFNGAFCPLKKTKCKSSK